MAQRDFPMNTLQENCTTFRKWCEAQLSEIEEMEIQKDNNSYEAPHDLMLLQGKRRVLEYFIGHHKFHSKRYRNPLAEDLESASSMVETARMKLEEHRAKKKVHGHLTLKHAKTVGEYSMLCDIERKLLSLE